jgi:GMP synthase-like glutamine amidotransferase
MHHDVAGAGVFSDVVTRSGHELDLWVPSRGRPPRPVTNYDAVMAFGGGMQADQEHIHPWLRIALDAPTECLDAHIPTLGLCLGGQMLARAAGGEVRQASRAEWGWAPIELTDEGLADPLFEGKPRRFDVYQWHSYEFGLPPGAVLLAYSATSLQCFRVGDCAWGLQWHPEVTGDTILLWARDYRIATDGIPVSIDMPELEFSVAQRTEATNNDGRELCARFLAAAEARAGVSGRRPVG